MAPLAGSGGGRRWRPHQPRKAARDPSLARPEAGGLLGGLRVEPVPEEVQRDERRQEHAEERRHGAVPDASLRIVVQRHEEVLRADGVLADIQRRVVGLHRGLASHRGAAEPVRALRAGVALGGEAHAVGPEIHRSVYGGDREAAEGDVREEHICFLPRLVVPRDAQELVAGGVPEDQSLQRQRQRPRRRHARGGLAGVL
mmetsp:Transcript_12161/g.38396  ORF Transcript_12161/g.38396 Transcript_12161/m.38396 type:complete len:200 (+) Transcript_12161:2-601(+)